MADDSATSLLLSLEDILDPILRSKVRALIPAMPSSFTTRHIRDAILTCQGDINSAADLLVGDPPKEIRESIEHLQNKFPLRSKEQITEILIQCVGSCEGAELRLSQQVDSKNGSQDELKLPSSTTTAETKHGREMVPSACASTKTKQMASEKSELAKDDIEKGKGSETSDDASDIQPPKKIKREETDGIPPTFFSPAPESSRSSVNSLLELFGSRAPEQECEEVLQLCKGNIENAFDMLQKKYAVHSEKKDGDCKATTRDCKPASNQIVLNFPATEPRDRGKKRKQRNVVSFLSILFLVY